MCTRRRWREMALFAVLLAAGAAWAGDQPPAVGATLPDFTLAAPKDPEDQEYFGLAGPINFKIGDIQAVVVIIEIFNMY
jgi:hypothetical protein